MKTKIAFPLAALAIGLTVPTFSAEISLESAPPVVVKTVPVAGATEVDPALTQIRVTYSKAMQDGSWSWSTWGEENYPETSGAPKYLADSRTCVLPVKLQPGKFYAIWLNSDKFKNFKDAGGRAAVPYLLTFFTGESQNGPARSSAERGGKGLAGQPQVTADKVAVEDIALRMLAAIRDKEDNVLKELAVDRIKGWRDSLPQFAFELRERVQQGTGKPFALKVDESLVDGDYAAVKCTGSAELEGRYLVLFFVKTEDGWRNCSLRNSPPSTPLSKHLADCVAEIQKLGKAATRKFVRIVLDDKRMTFEGEATTWDKLEALVSAIPERSRTVLEWAVASTQITIQQQSEWTARFRELARKHGFEYSSYVGVHAFGSKGGMPPTSHTKTMAPASEKELALLLNDDQRAVLAWTDRQFGGFFDKRTFDGWSEEERAKFETKLIDALNGPRSGDYFQAISTLPALRSTNALPKLRAIAFERVDRNNRDRWMAVRALGLTSDREAVPDLIHLVYHGNQNTHWWAQISLVRITGQNFGKDWNAWGKWWNEQNGQPPFKPEIIRWWNGQPEPDKLEASLDESDEKFLAGIKSK